MKTKLGLLLTFLLLSQAPSFAQSNLVLLIDQSTQQIDWLNGSSITRTQGPFDNNDFGQFINVFRQASILSPLLTYSGPGSHTGVFFEFSVDHTTITGISLSTTFPPGEGAMFSGTPEGLATPTFSFGDWSHFASLNRGDYTLNPELAIWSGGIQVVVVPEPASWMLLLVGVGSIVVARARHLRARAGA